MSADLLLEIGTEEIPARFIDSIKSGMTDYLENKFRELRISHGDISVKSTPRRFSLLIKDLSDTQNESSQLVRGPSKLAAYESGNLPSKALLGFLSSKGASESDIFFREEKGTEYVFIDQKLASGMTESYLEEIFSGMVASLVFDKPMKWGSSDVKFIRPIRRLLCLYGEKTLPLKLFGLTAGNTTFGHRFLGSSNIVVDKIENYEKLLRENYCILDDEERKSMILDQINKIANDQNLHVIVDEDLLNEINYIVEYPTALCGYFDEKYLSLPGEVIIVPMKDHQRYFPLTDKNGKLVNKFITVRNGGSDFIENVKKGNEKVLEARLADAKFFYDEDISKPFKDYQHELGNVVYQEKLGTMADKSSRLEILTEKITIMLKLDDEKLVNITKAVGLCKADLCTKLVGEFEELEGVMGSYYAKNSGESDAVCLAIREHYLPKFPGDDLPKSMEGTVLAMADRVDSLCGFFAAGMKPTGSQDPYGLRRAAIALITIAEKGRLDISLTGMIKASLDIYKDVMKFNYDETFAELKDFLSSRLENILIDKGYKYYLADAVLDEKLNVYDIMERLTQLDAWLKEEDKSEELNAFTRVLNISKDFEPGYINKALFKDPDENFLYDNFENSIETLNKYKSKKDYNAYLNNISKLKTQINSYFDSVMINDENPDVKKNRQSLIANIRDALKAVCDFSKIPV